MVSVLSIRRCVSDRDLLWRVLDYDLHGGVARHDELERLGIAVVHWLMDGVWRYVYEIARADLKVAQYYASRHAWVAAANRAKSILQSYPGATAIMPALKIQLQAYQQLGLDELAADTQRIIDLN